MFTQIVRLLEAVILRADTVLTKTNDIHCEIRDLKDGNKRIMAAIDDLNAQVSALGTSISAEIAAATTAITTALQNNDTAGVEAAVANLKGLQTTVEAFTASLAPPATA